MGYRPEGSNPCRGIRRYRRKGRERFLSDDDIGRIAARLSAHVAKVATRSRRRAAPDADRVPQVRGLDASLVGLPSGPPVPARQQDRTENGVAVAPGPYRHRAHPAHGRLDVPAATRRPAAGTGVGRKTSGGVSAPKRTCTTSACMT